MVISDVAADREYKPYLDAARDAGYSYVQSTPLLTSEGITVGMVSTMFANTYVPTEVEMATCRRYGRLAADHLGPLLNGLQVVDPPRLLHNEFYARLPTSVQPAPVVRL